MSSSSDTNVGAAGGPGGGTASTAAASGVSSAVTTPSGVPAKIMHVKTAQVESVSSSSIMTSGSVSSTTTVGAVKVATGVVGSSGIGAQQASATTTATALGATSPIVLSAAGAQSATATATAIRAIGGASGQSTQVRVVMPTIMAPSMIKQLESATVASSGRTQITAIPTATARSVANTTSITVSRPAITQTAYLPRAGVTTAQMPTGTVGVTSSGQRLVTPIRGATVTGATAATVAGLTAAGGFVRGTAVSRASTSPATTVISPATNTTWMAANSTGQVQLIRAIPHQSRPRIITTQGLATATANVCGTALVNAVQASAAGQQQQQQQNQQQGQGTTTTTPTSTTLQAVASQSSALSQQQQQQTYVATLLPQRQHPQATLVYTSSVGSGTSQSQLAQAQQLTATAVASCQRFAVAAPLSATAGAGVVATPRQIRPIPLGKPFATAKLNTTSISIRAPNLPQLTPTLSAVAGGGGGGGTSTTTAGGAVGIVGGATARSSTIGGVGGPTASVIPTANLSAARIIQLQQQPGGGTQQIIGSAGRLPGNVMVQPIIVNASNAGKFGFRQPVTMAAKSSLTITQLGIGNRPSAGTNAAGQSTVAGSNVQGGSSGVSGAASSAAGSLITTSASTTVAGVQMVSVSQGGVVTSSAGGATVVPLAMTARGASAANILTGTITPIKTAGGALTMGKVMSPAHLAAATATAGVQRTVATSMAVAAASSPNSSGPRSSSNANALLPPGSTFYYESVPASSVQVSTGVLSLTTTTATSSTMSQQQQSQLAASSFASHAHGGNSTATFTVVPAGGARTIGQLQIPTSSGGTQIQAVPVRFSAQMAAGDGGGGAQSSPQLVQGTICSTGQQILIPASAGHQGATTAQPLMIPLQTSIKMTTALAGSGAGGGGGSATSSVVASSILRKRDNDGVPTIRAAKNLGPTLLSMGTLAGSPASVSSSGSASSSVPGGNTYTITSVHGALTAEALAKKERAAANAIMASSQSSRADSPASSDGSTTVSANSSPGIEQQMQDGSMVLNCMPGTSETHFNPINELYSNHHSLVMQHSHLSGTPPTSRNASLDQMQLYGGGAVSAQRYNGAIECLPRKKARRSTNDSQLSAQSQSSLSLPPPQATPTCAPTATSVASGELLATSSGTAGNNNCALASGSHDANNAAQHTNNHKTNNVPPIVGNKENAKPLEFVLRRPRTCTILQNYKVSWKPTHNHFLRHSDVKLREDRRPTVVDLANQSNILQKINGWRIYRLRSQMDDLCENEHFAFKKLEEMLDYMQLQEPIPSPEMERVSEMLKGNMQRSKIIVDGIKEAQNQIMKIFDHESHISDIINRCASKRNFKKRDKV